MSRDLASDLLRLSQWVRMGKGDDTIVEIKREIALKTFLIPRPRDWRSSPSPRVVAQSADRTAGGADGPAHAPGSIRWNLPDLSCHRAPDPWNSSWPRTIPGVMKYVPVQPARTRYSSTGVFLPSVAA